VVVAVDARELLELARQEHVLRTPEPEQARPRPEPVEDRLHDLGLATPERANRDPPDHFRVHV
jgi:hypothetical protein